MDELDIEIVKELEREKRSLRGLSRFLRVPITTLHNRIKKLEKKGVIKKYKAEVDWEALGFKVFAYVLIYVDATELKKLNKSQQDIKNALLSFEFVEECHIITGDADLIAKLKAKSTKELGELITKNIQSIMGISKTKTLICID